VRGSEYQESTGPEEIGEGAGEGRGIVPIRAVVTADPLQDVGSELGVRGRLLEALDSRPDFRPEVLLVQRPEGGGVIAVPQPNLVHFIGEIHDVNVVGFGEVVIVAGNPEHWSNGAVETLRQTSRQGDRGERLVEREEGAQEQSGLLTCSDAESTTRKQALEVVLGGSCLHHEGLAERRVERDLPRFHETVDVPGRWTCERRGLETKGHVRCAKKMARGAVSEIGAPS
jgi:hypothetical protein